MPVLIITPESTAETCEGADECAPGSQEWSGIMPALIPKPRSPSGRTSRHHSGRARRDAWRLGNVRSGDWLPHRANIATSARVAACVATR